MSIQVIGDEIHYDGELVAIMTTNPAPTLRDRFTEALDGGDVNHSDTLDELEKKATESARGGLLRMTDLATIIARLKEA